MKYSSEEKVKDFASKLRMAILSKLMTLMVRRMLFSALLMLVVVAFNREWFQAQSAALPIVIGLIVYDALSYAVGCIRGYMEAIQDVITVSSMLVPIGSSIKSDNIGGEEHRDEE